MAHGYIGAQPTTTTDIAVIADISESLDISGFTPHITVSSLPPLAVSSITLVEPMAVSGTVTTAAPANQNVSGISLDAIEVAAEAIQVDAAAMEVLLTGIDADTDAIKTDAAAIEALLTLANVDHAANEVLLTGIDADTNAIKVDTAANEVLLTGIDTVLDNILTKNTEIDTALDTIDAVLDNSLTKQTEIDAVLDTIKIDTEAIETATEAIQVDAAAIEVLLTNANTDHAANEVLLTAIDTVLDTIKVDTEAIETATEAIQVDTAANEVLLTSIKTAVEVIDNAISGNEMQVDVISMPTTTVTGSVTAAVAFPATTGITGGGAESGVQRVTIANDSTGSVGIKPSTSSYLSHVYIDLDAAGDNPTTNTEVIAAPGASSKLVIYGVQGSIVGNAATAVGNWYLSDGNTAAATTLWTARAQGTTNTQFELTFPYGVALTTNTALKVTSSEGSGNIFINAVVYYRTEAV